MSELGKMLIGLGALLVVLGIVLLAAGKLQLPLGRLPGDITWRGLFAGLEKSYSELPTRWSA